MGSLACSMKPQLFHQPPKDHHHQHHDISGLLSPSTLITESCRLFPTWEGVLQVFVWALLSAWHTSHTLSAFLTSAPPLGFALAALSPVKFVSAPPPHHLPSRSGISPLNSQEVLKSLTQRPAHSSQWVVLAPP